MKNGEMVDGLGIELTWLSDLPVKEIGARQSALDPDGLVTVNQNGSVSVRKPGQNSSLTLAGSPANGQVSSKAVELPFVMDQTNLSKHLNGAKLTGIGVGGGILFGSFNVAYPGRVMRPGDPQLLAETLSSQVEVLSALRGGLEVFRNNSTTFAERNKASEYVRALKTLQTASRSHVDIDQTRQTLAGVYDFLLERPNDRQLSRFEIGWSGMSYETRADFVEKLRTLNELVGLGKEQECRSRENRKTDDCRSAIPSEYIRVMESRSTECRIPRRKRFCAAG